MARRSTTTNHLLNYPPRGTACGLYYPKDLYKKGFGSYFEEDITCKKCLEYIAKERGER